MPGCHPVLLLHVIPAAVARPGRPLIPFDTNSVVTGNRGFVLGSLEKATLRGDEAEGKSGFISSCNLTGRNENHYSGFLSKERNQRIQRDMRFAERQVECFNAP